MQPTLSYKKIPSPEQRLSAMFQAFNGLMLVLDPSGKILESTAGGDSPFSAMMQKTSSGKFQDAVPLEVWQKYNKALQEIHNGSKAALFEYVLDGRKELVWYESTLVPFENGQNIMFVRDITKYKQPQSDELNLAYDTTIESWSKALYLRDQETEDHTRRVTEMTLDLSRRLNLPESDFINIRRGAALHDIGKVAIPDSILFKPGPLTEEEWRIMRRHPVIAAEIISPIPHLAAALPIPRSHHEKWDGSGYPEGLVGEAIPLFARIFAFADVYDALTSDRPYRAAWTQANAVVYIAEQSGKHFDPSIVPVFIRMIVE